MKPEISVRRRLRDSRNKSFSLSFNNDSTESGLSILLDSPVLFNSPKDVPQLRSILKKRKTDSGFQHSKSIGNDTITLDSSCEVIGKSSCSSALEDGFDWINTPRSARVRHKLFLGSMSKSPTFSQKRKSIDKNEEDELVIKKNYNILPITKKEANAKAVTENFLVGSKRRNLEDWLNTAVKQKITTPPMSLSPPTKEMEYDPIVDRELRRLYGDDWDASLSKKAKTNIKKSKIKSPHRAVHTDIRPTCKESNILPTKAKTDRKNVRRKVFDDPIGELVADNKIEKILPNTKKTRKKIKRSISPEKDRTPSGLKTPRRTFLASLSVSTPTTANHPEAMFFKLNFAKKKEELCLKLFKLYNSEVFSNQLPEEMPISWNSKMRGTAGFCYSKRKQTKDGIIRCSRLELSSRVIDRADRLRDTLIHEMCHAASWIVNGVRDGHGSIWLSWAKKAAVRFPELPLIKRCHNYKIETKFTYRCTVCSYSINRQSRSIDTNRKRCGRCFGVLELLFNKKKRGLREAPEFETTRTIRAPNRYAKFVKENYKSVKESMPSGTKSGDVMKKIAKIYDNFKKTLE